MLVITAHRRIAHQLLCLHYLICPRFDTDRYQVVCIILIVCVAVVISALYVVCAL